MNRRMMRVFAMHRLMNQEGGDAGGQGGGSPTPTPAPTSTGGNKPERETFSREYVTELREEIKATREKTQAKLTEAEQKATAAEAKAAEAETRATQRIIKAELKAEAIALGMVDLDGLTFVDMAQVTLNEDGTVKGGKEALEALKKAKPYLFNHNGGNTSPPGTPPKPDDKGAVKKAKDMTPEEYAKAREKIRRGQV